MLGWWLEVHHVMARADYGYLQCPDPVTAPRLLRVPRSSGDTSMVCVPAVPRALWLSPCGPSRAPGPGSSSAHPCWWGSEEGAWGRLSPQPGGVWAGTSCSLATSIWPRDTRLTMHQGDGKAVFGQQGSFTHFSLNLC